MNVYSKQTVILRSRPLSVYYNKTEVFYVNIGTNIRYENSESDAQKLTDELRDTLASLKWEIWEQFPVTRGDSFSDNCVYGTVGVMPGECVFVEKIKVKKN